jgi:hypothetical protein
MIPRGGTFDTHSGLTKLQLAMARVRQTGRFEELQLPQHSSVQTVRFEETSNGNKTAILFPIVCIQPLACFHFALLSPSC